MGNGMVMRIELGRGENDSDAKEWTRLRVMSRLRRFRSRSRTSMKSAVSEEHLRGTPVP
jgi:hypothetical protein